jgi:hypothetical protein
MAKRPESIYPRTYWGLEKELWVFIAVMILFVLPALILHRLYSTNLIVTTRSPDTSQLEQSYDSGREVCVQSISGTCN